MRKAVLFVICLNALCLALTLAANLARAGDEDLTSSVYLVFDPETGEFVTVEDQNRVAQDHEAREPAVATNGHSPSHGQSDSLKLPFPAGIALGIGLVAGVLIWAQKKSRKRPSGD